MRIFEVENIEHPLESQFVEIEAVAHVVIGRYRFGIIIDHDTAVSLLAYGIEGVYPAPVKFYRASDTVGSRPEYDNRTTVTEVTDVVSRTAVS